MSGFPSGSDEYRRESEQHGDERDRFKRRIRFGDSLLSAVPVRQSLPAPSLPLETTKQEDNE